MQTTQQVELVLFKENDFEQLIHWVTTPHLLFQWTGSRFTFPLTKDQLSKHLKKVSERPDQHKVFKVIEANTKMHIGHCELVDIDKQKKKGRLVRLLIGTRNKRGRGLGEQVVRTMLKKAFDKYDLEEVSCHVFAYNQTAIYCYQKVGFEFCETLKGARQFNGDDYDLHVMKITKTGFYNH